MGDMELNEENDLKKFQADGRPSGDSGYNTESFSGSSFGTDSLQLHQLNIDEEKKHIEEENLKSIIIKSFTPDQDRDTYLHIFTAQEQLEEAVQLIQLCPDSRLLDIQNLRDQAVIHVAAYLGFTLVIRMCLEKGAKMDLVDNTGKNIFHLFAEHDQFASLTSIVDKFRELNRVRELVDLLNATDNDGCTPFFLAVSKKRKEICRYLATHDDLGVDVSAMEQKCGNSPLHEAVMSENNADMVYFILQYCKVSVNSVNNQNITPLHIAASKGDEAICALLLLFNAQRDIEDANGNIPAVYAANDRILERLKV